MKKHRLLVVAALLSSACGLPAAAQSLDANFAAATFYAPGTVYSALEQPDGKKVVLGDFSRVDGTASARLMRFNANGSVDAVFRQNVGTAGPIYRMVLQSNGQLLLTSGTAAPLTAGGITRNTLLRLNADGTADPTLNIGAGPTSTSQPNYASADITLPLPNGQILAVGGFDHFGGTVANNLVRLNASGSVDANFNSGTGADGYVGTAVLLPNGKLLIGGYFANYNGTPRNGLARLNTDGSLDPTFNSNFTAGSSVDHLAVLPDGRILVAGTIDPAVASSTPGLVRLLADGSADNTFSVPAGIMGGNVFSYYGNAIELQADGRILIANDGSIASYPVARLNADGTLDGTFSVVAPPDFYLNSLTLLASGKILMAGRYRATLNYAYNPLLQLTSTGVVDPTFQPTYRANGSVSTLAQQADGKLLATGDFSEVNGQVAQGLARFNNDGTFDASYAGAASLLSLPRECALQPDGRLLVLTGSSVQRLLATGAADNSFASAFVGPNPRRLFRQADGRVLVAGVGSGVMVRLLANGNSDATFTLGASFDRTQAPTIRAISQQADGKILVTGNFLVAGTPRGIVRLETTGALDATFTGSSFTTIIIPASLTVQPDGKILVGGTFSAYGGTPRANIVRLNPNGSLDAGFVPPAAATGIVSCVLLQPNGRILLGGTYAAPGLPANLARLLTDGSADASFAATAVPNSTVRTLLIQPDGKIVLGGSFTQVNGQPNQGLARITASNVLSVAAPQAMAARTEAWPVPAHAVLNVVPAPGAHPEFIDLLDGLGRPVLHRAVAGHGATALDLAALAAGTYLLRVTYTEGTVVRRVQVQ